MLRRKLPEEVLAGRRLLPSSLFRRDDVTSYLANLDRALDATEVELGESGTRRPVRADPTARPSHGFGVVGRT